jgi:hypothetical protein
LLGSCQFRVVKYSSPQIALSKLTTGGSGGLFAYGASEYAVAAYQSGAAPNNNVRYKVLADAEI